ncbi:MAG: 4-alpha-glucanotransferase [Oscillospiraceae bacterium]|nr:4-alpha-glucanotransferase [Oscillospiraceae bacterium]
MRESGILMHITSLPGKYGVGTMGKEAFSFVDFLCAAGQSYWQILPLTPTGYGDSPYQSCSAYAGNHYLIDLESLIEEGLLLQGEVEGFHWCDREDKADFGLLYNSRLKVLRLAFRRFNGSDAFDAFCCENSGWLEDFALFMALKEETGGKSWYEWEPGLKYRDPQALEQARQRLASELAFYRFVQFLFDRQWQKLRCYAREKGIRFIGDVPIYVPLDSVEVWSEPRLFQLDEALEPVAVAGCPPDAFSEDGQLWGNPLYRWDAMAEEGYGWWLRRLGAAGKLYDVVRLDHFRGFAAYWAVPYGDKNSRGGKWVEGPGEEFMTAVQRALPEISLIAEDLGFLTQEVLDLRDGSGFPGMKVLQFAFDSREPSDYLPHNYPANCVCYTGTHDNMTTRQWFEAASEEAVEYAAEYMRLTEEEGYVRGMIRTAMSSVSRLCVVPLQDWLDLGGEARMNFPGTLSDSNWTWRLKSGIINHTLAKSIRNMTVLYGRGAKQEVNNSGESA